MGRREEREHGRMKNQVMNCVEDRSVNGVSVSRRISMDETSNGAWRAFVGGGRGCGDSRTSV